MLGMREHDRLSDGEDRRRLDDVGVAVSRRILVGIYAIHLGLGAGRSVRHMPSVAHNAFELVDGSAL